MPWPISATQRKLSRGCLNEGDKAGDLIQNRRRVDVVRIRRTTGSNFVSDGRGDRIRTCDPRLPSRCATRLAQSPAQRLGGKRNCHQTPMIAADAPTCGAEAGGPEGSNYNLDVMSAAYRELKPSPAARA